MDAYRMKTAADATARSIRGWVLERGILYGLLETPILAIMGGVFYRVIPYRYALISVLLAFMALPLWISYRKTAASDPADPVHHLPRYAIYSLLPGAIFTVARIPTHYLWGLVYWHPWYDFGSELTGAPIGQYSSLFPGAFLNALQGWSIAMGFYVLFRRHSLINAILYIGVWDSSLYSYVFPTYSRVGLPSPPLWHVVDVWAHSAMAVTAWLMPRLHGMYWPRLGVGQRGAAIAATIVIVFTPTSFALWRATTWQFPIDQAIDETTFSRPGLLTMSDAPMLRSLGTDAEYLFSLRFGPRGYKNYFHQARDLDAAPVRVTATLWQQGQVIAWCSSYLQRLESPNQITAPQQFPAVYERMQFTVIPVQCRGPAGAASRLATGSLVTVQWRAQMTLIGDRLRQTRTFDGSQSSLLTKTIR